MSKKKKHKHKPGGGVARSVTFHGSVLQSIRQHGRGSPNAEICGALIGRQSDAGTFVSGAVPGEGAAQGGAHVTFTQEAWVRIHEEKDRKYSGQAIVGWYHSHPGFGVFLSDHDIFIHKNFFSDPGSLAWVYDPHSDEEGCFGWNGGEVLRLERYVVVTETSRDTVPKSNPSHIPQGTGLGLERHRAFEIWRSSKTIRGLIIAAAAIVLALLAGLGMYSLLRSSWFERIRGKGEKPRQVNRSVENSADRAPTKVKESESPLGATLTATNTPANHGNGRKRNGVHDEQ